MSVEIVGPFPPDVNLGALHGDASGGILKYLGGGSGNNPLNWVLVGGTLSDHPDTTGWGTRQKGALWYNGPLESFFSWNGEEIKRVGATVTTGVGGVAAFVVFSVSGGTVTVRRSSNVSGVTRHATGDFTITFEEAMEDGFYAAVFGARGTAATNAATVDPTMCSVAIFQ